MAVIAIAGPVRNNRVTMPNAENWGMLDGEELKSLFNMKNFILLNDFVSAAYGVATLNDDELKRVNKASIQ